MAALSGETLVQNAENITYLDRDRALVGTKTTGNGALLCEEERTGMERFQK